MRPVLALCLIVAMAASQATAQTAADRLLARMTLEEKVGQLFMSWILSREEGQGSARAELIAQIEDVGLGGVVLSLGEAGEAASLIRDLQARTKVPLLVAGDFEGGVAFRLSGATQLGCNMLVGATGDARLAEAMGRVTAVEARALGFHWAFAPVVDVNVNPRNPIINVRSFGEDPAAVARLGAAAVRGMEAAGVLSTLKHFPGHGDVATDSHLELPTVTGDRARLDRIELVPFRAGIAAGASAVMTGHLSVPGLGEDPGVAATLSAKILTGVLRDEMGFDGIIVTDALDMGGVKGGRSPADAAVRALNAGADLLLMPPEPRQTRAALVDAVRRGVVSEERLDAAVLRLLRAKERLGLLSGGGLVDAAWREVVSSEPHRELAGEIAARGVTLVRDEQGLVPLPPARRQVLLALVDQPEDSGMSVDGWFSAAGADVLRHRLHPESATADIERAIADIAAADLVVAALHVRVRSYSGVIGLPPSLRPVAAALAAAPRSVAVSFGNPYLIDELPGLSTYLCAYNDGPHTERAVWSILEGSAPAFGRLPVSLPGVAGVGGGLGYLPGRDLGRATPVEAGFAPDLEERVQALLERAVVDRVFPGAVALVARRGDVVVHTAVGRATYAPGAASITPASVFDLASLTKVCATGPVVLRLVARGELSLDQRVSELVPAFEGPGKDAVTIRHLMTHASGLPAYVRFFREIEGSDAIVDAAARTELRSEPGEKYVYSDLGLILLMACAERATGVDFATLAQREVFEPLRMAGARFARTGAAIDAVPTEVCPWRGRLVRGEVHDENAYAMGGVSGHAGLFATAEDVARVGVAFCGGGRAWLPAPLVRTAVQPAGVVPGSSRALCWDTYRPGQSGGSRLSPGAFGHTGFTGTSIWCDPRTDVCLVLLTNRVHPTREDSRIGRVRGAFADLVMSSLDR